MISGSLLQQFSYICFFNLFGYKVIQLIFLLWKSSQVKFCKSTFGVSSQCTVNNGESLPADHTSYSTEQSEDCHPHGDSKVTGFDLSGELRE